jgi:ADP-heptose:LPS heptosyltransferase
MWDLLRNAAFLVCPDTGIAHLARLVGVPTVALYGPGSPISTGPGLFWMASPFRAIWDPDVPCRNQASAGEASPSAATLCASEESRSSK